MLGYVAIYHRKQLFRMNIPTKKITRDELGPEESLCDYCSAKCCRYFALPIEKPEDYRAFEYLRWYLLHTHAAAFVEDDTWYLIIHTECKHLQADNRCGIYAVSYTHLTLPTIYSV